MRPEPEDLVRDASMSIGALLGVFEGKTNERSKDSGNRSLVCGSGLFAELIKSLIVLQRFNARVSDGPCRAFQPLPLKYLFWLVAFW